MLLYVDAWKLNDLPMVSKTFHVTAIIDPLGHPKRLLVWVLIYIKGCARANLAMWVVCHTGLITTGMVGRIQSTMGMFPSIDNEGPYLSRC